MDGSCAMQDTSDTEKPLPTESSSFNPSDDILEEARRITSHDRNNIYGPPERNLGNIAKMWSVILGVEVSAQQVSLCMIATKIARQVNAPHRDNWVDIVGYARIGAELNGK